MDCCRFFARRTQIQMADELTLATAPTSKRFPTTNQAKACYMCAACMAPDGSAPGAATRVTRATDCHQSHPLR